MVEEQNHLGPKEIADLGRSYEAVLAQQPWDVDVPELPPTAAAPAPAENPPSPVRIIEALLFVGGAPLTAVRATEIVRGLTPERFAEAVATLNHDYRLQGRPYAIQPQ